MTLTARAMVAVMAAGALLGALSRDASAQEVAPATPAPTPRDEGIDLRLVGGVTAIAAGGLSFVAGNIAALKINGIRDDDAWNDYRAQFPNSPDICEVAREGGQPEPALAKSGALSSEEAAAVCDEAKTLEVLQVVFYGVGALAIATGVVVIATRPERAPERGAVAIVPRLGAGRAALDLTVRF